MHRTTVTVALVCLAVVLCGTQPHVSPGSRLVASAWCQMSGDGPQSSGVPGVTCFVPTDDAVPGGKVLTRVNCQLDPDLGAVRSCELGLTTYNVGGDGLVTIAQRAYRADFDAVQETMRLSPASADADELVLLRVRADAALRELGTEYATVVGRVHSGMTLRRLRRQFSELRWTAILADLRRMQSGSPAPRS